MAVRNMSSRQVLWIKSIIKRCMYGWFTYILYIYISSMYFINNLLRVGSCYEAYKYGWSHTQDLRTGLWWYLISLSWCTDNLSLSERRRLGVG